VRPVVAQITFLRAHLNGLDETHVARRGAEVFQAGGQFDETGDELNSYFAPNALMHAHAEESDVVLSSAMPKMQWILDSFSVPSRFAQQAENSIASIDVLSID
jgi:hypothetical protein